MIKNSSIKESLWKNGLGLTRQIAIFPENSCLGDNNFNWRISSAEITGSNSFSPFKNYERILVVWRGTGLLLNGHKLLPHLPFSFSGEELINCDLINNSNVSDFGIIYKKELARPSLQVLSFTNSETLKMQDGKNFIFLAEGNDCQVLEARFEVGDCLSVDNEKEIFIFSKSNFTIYLIHL